MDNQDKSLERGEEGSFSVNAGSSKSTTLTSVMHLPGSTPQPPASDSSNGLNVTKIQGELSTAGTASIGLPIEEAEVKLMDKALRMQNAQKQQQNHQQLFENFALLEESISDLNRSNTPGSSVLERPHDLFSLKTEKDRLDMGSVSFGQSQKDLDVNERLLGDNTLDILRDLDLPGSLSDLNEFYLADEAAFLSSLSVDDALLGDGNMETKPIVSSSGGNCKNVNGADQQQLGPGISMPVIKTEKDADTSFIQLYTPGVIKQENERQSYCQISSLDIPGTHSSVGSMSGPSYHYGANTSTAVSVQQDQKPVFGLYPPLPSVSDSWNRGQEFGDGSGMSTPSSSSFPVSFSR